MPPPLNPRPIAVARVTSKILRRSDDEQARSRGGTIGPVTNGDTEGQPQHSHGREFPADGGHRQTRRRLLSGWEKLVVGAAVCAIVLLTVLALANEATKLACLGQRTSELGTPGLDEGDVLILLFAAHALLLVPACVGGLIAAARATMAKSTGGEALRMIARWLLVLALLVFTGFLVAQIRHEAASIAEHRRPEYAERAC